MVPYRAKMLTLWRQNMQKQCRVTASLWLHTNMCKFLILCANNAWWQTLTYNPNRKIKRRGSVQVVSTKDVVRCHTRLLWHAASAFWRILFVLAKAVAYGVGSQDAVMKKAKENKFDTIFCFSIGKVYKPGVPQVAPYGVCFFLVPWFWDAKLTSVLF